MLEVRDEFSLPLDEVRAAWTATLPKLFGGVAELANRHGDPEGAAESAAHPDQDGSGQDGKATGGSVTLELTEPQAADESGTTPKPGGPIDPA